MELTNIDNIKSLLRRHGFKFSKSLGQNFLTNAQVVNDIVTQSEIDKDCAVIEIGAGIGVLTKRLSEAAGEVVSVEIDASLKPILDETLSDCANIKVVFGDIMKTDLKTLIAENITKRKIKVCANLPYYITTPVITKLLEQDFGISSLTVMVQLEVANRLCGTGDGGAITMFCKYHCDPRLLFKVPRSDFIPSPNVDSAVVLMDVLPQKGAQPEDEELFFECIKGGFSQKRKTLSNSLSSYFGGRLGKSEIIEALNECEISPNARAQELAVTDFARLSDIVGKILKNK